MSDPSDLPAAPAPIPAAAPGPAAPAGADPAGSAPAGPTAGSPVAAAAGPAARAAAVAPGSRPPVAGGELRLGRPRGPWRRAGLALLVVLAGVLFWLLRLQGQVQELRQLVQDGAARLAAQADSGRTQDETLARLDQRLAALEQGTAEPAAAGAGNAELRRVREELALLEAERLVSWAQSELQISGDTVAAQAALRAADTRLAGVARPQAVRARAALARDAERLKALPAVDAVAIAARIDQLLQAVDGWNLVADAARRVAAATPAPARRAANEPAPAVLVQVRNWISAEFGDLVRIREVDTPSALLLTPGQQQLARERARLGLIELRQAVLARNDRQFRAATAEVQMLIGRYFDTVQPAVQAAQAQLRALAATPVSVAPPALDDSLGALRAARGAGAS